LEAITGPTPHLFNQMMLRFLMISTRAIQRPESSIKARFIACVAIVITAMFGARVAHAQMAYKSPEDAVSALITAAKADDTKSVLNVLGPMAAGILSSGDSVADAGERKIFLEAYDKKHGIEKNGDDMALLLVGDVDWPFPIPLVRRDGSWLFDTAAGRDEILYRRVGRNELSAIQVCLAYVDAQNEYAAQSYARAGLASYAQRIRSQPGKMDGLYWQTQAGEPASPLGELAARASAAGYRGGDGPRPFLGYYYKILTRQGPAAPGGVMDYVVHGNMIGGFALVAYPAEYGNSGVMSFIVNHEGVVFEKDLGARTSQIAQAMTAYNPDQSWKKATISAP
jgi:Protein of unknown function (DUF2950)